MSGAEGLIAVGLAGNVLQFIDFGTKLCARIREYSSAAGGAPKKIESLARRLSLVLRTLEGLSESGLMTVDLEQTTIQSCIARARELNSLLDKFKIDSPAVANDDRGLKRADRRIGGIEKTWKAFNSLRGEKKVEEFQNTLDSLLSVISLQLHVRTASASIGLEHNTEQTLNVMVDLQEWMKSMTLNHRENSEESKAIFMVPYMRNPSFVGREDIFDELDAIFTSAGDSQRKAALCGLGGVGKSQIAVEYAYRLKKRLPLCSIFWIHASNTARFEEGYKEIASRCGIPGRDDMKSDLMQLVRNWLESNSKCSWMMIVDNVDDANLFLREKTYTGKTLLEYIPQSSNGSVLYTTRNRDIGVDLTWHPINVPLMNPMEARLLLSDKIGGEGTEDEQSQLLEQLDYLPLAITQAAAFMAKRHKTISQYLDHYRRSDSIRIRLLNHEFTDYGRETRPLESVTTTWIISFEQIRAENPRAADLLSLMSFFDRQGIPGSLLIVEREDPLDFEEAIGMLEAYSLVVVDYKGNSYNMHRLVQLATRTWLGSYDEKGAKKWMSQALSILSTRFPNGDYETWKLCATYLPHVEAVLNYDLEGCSHEVVLARANLLHNTSRYMKMQGSFEVASTRAKEALQLREKLLGREHPDALDSVCNLAAVLLKQGKQEAAETMARQALEGREKALGKAHPDTLASADNLAFVLEKQGKYEAAEAMARLALRGRENALGREHPDTLTSVDNLAWALEKQGKHEAAEAMAIRALEWREKTIGTDHPDTLASVHSLATAFGGQGKFKAAEVMYRRAIEGREKVLGREHPDTLWSVFNLAGILERQNKYKEAEVMCRRALEGREKVLGKEHLDTLRSVYGLAGILERQNKYKEAEVMERRALEGREKVLGKTHPDTLASTSKLAFVLKRQGKYEAAEAVNQRGARREKKGFGNGASQTLGSAP